MLKLPGKNGTMPVKCGWMHGSVYTLKAEFDPARDWAAELEPAGTRCDRAVWKRPGWKSCRAGIFQMEDIMMQTVAPAGTRPLTRFWAGDLKSRTICQIYGEPASGKSTLCIIAAVASLRAGDSVVYIDSEGFSIERFRQIAGTDTDKIADRLFLFEPIDFEHQGAMIAEAEKVLKAHKTGLLVMDSATALYRTDLEKGRDAMQALTRQMIHLLGYAKRYDIPVIITNQVYMDTVKNTYSVLGGLRLSISQNQSSALTVLMMRPDAAGNTALNTAPALKELRLISRL